jgi:hypothetical protein
MRRKGGGQQSQEDDDRHDNPADHESLVPEDSAAQELPG